MTKYQIALFSHGADDEVRVLRSTLVRRINELGVDSAHVSFLDESTLGMRDPKAPLVGAYISIVTAPRTLAPVVDLLLAGTMIVPVVPNLEEFTSFVFPEMCSINGIALTGDDPEHERVAAVLLEGLGLLRRSRRLFISYRRVETQGIAIQLYELLDSRGFDVFLDTHSIRPGEPFQDVLWHRLADTDVIVLLDSPKFLESRWTEEELAKANSTNVQIVQLIWPGKSLAAPSAFSRAVPLMADDFDGGTLGPNARLKTVTAERISVEVESLRARALAARYAYLLEEVCVEAKRLGLSPQVQPDRYITFEPAPDKFYVAVPAVGVPDAVKYHEIEDALERHPKAKTQIALIYDERGIRDKWLQHLAWLNRQNLRVRSIQVAQASSWLEGLK